VAPTAAIPALILVPPPDSWLAARMQQNGSSGSNGSEGCGGARARQALSFSPLPAATTRVRRFIQERRTLPLPRVMVVFSAAGDTEKPGDAMSSSDSAAEDDFRKPASPAPSFALSKPLRSSLNTPEQEVGQAALLNRYTGVKSRSTGTQTR